MNYLTKLSSLIQTLEKEYKKYKNLLSTPSYKKHSLQTTIIKIKTLLDLLKSEITKFKKIFPLITEIKIENEKFENLKKKKFKNPKFTSLINKNIISKHSIFQFNIILIIKAF